MPKTSSIIRTDCLTCLRLDNLKVDISYNNYNNIYDIKHMNERSRRPSWKYGHLYPCINSVLQTTISCIAAGWGGGGHEYRVIPNTNTAVETKIIH